MAGRQVRPRGLSWLFVVAALLLAAWTAPPAALASVQLPGLMEGYVIGGGASLEGVGPFARVGADVGWGTETSRVHYRLRASMPLGLAAEAGVAWTDWADVSLLGQALELGVAAHLIWEPGWRDRLQVRGFAGRVGSSPHLLDRDVVYGRVQYDARVAYAWPWSVQMRTLLLYGHARPAQGASGASGDFYAVALTVPIQWEYLRVIGRAGYSGGSDALPDFRFRLGDYADAWLRGYDRGTFAGPLMAAVNAEYRRPWFEHAPNLLLALMEAGPFVDVAAVAGPGEPLAWHSSYGLTTAWPFGSLQIGWDLAWNETGAARSAIRLSEEF